MIPLGGDFVFVPIVGVELLFDQFVEVAELGDLFLVVGRRSPFVPRPGQRPRVGRVGRLLVQRADIGAALVPVGLIAADTPFLELVTAVLDARIGLAPVILIFIRSTKSSTVPCRQTQKVSSLARLSAVASPMIAPSLNDQILRVAVPALETLAVEDRLKARFVVGGGSAWGQQHAGGEDADDRQRSAG